MKKQQISQYYITLLKKYNYEYHSSLNILLYMINSHYPDQEIELYLKLAEQQYIQKQKIENQIVSSFSDFKKYSKYKIIFKERVIIFYD